MTQAKDMKFGKLTLLSPGGLETRNGVTVTGKVGEPCSGQWQQDGEEDVCSGEQEKEVSAHKGGGEGSSMPPGHRILLLKLLRERRFVTPTHF